MTIQLGWKNIWRNPVRSIVVISAVVIGVWAAIFISALSNGLTSHYLSSQLDTYIGHAAISTQAFWDERTSEHIIPNEQLAPVIKALERDSLVKSLTPITIAEGMIASATYSSGVQIRGIDIASDTTCFNTHTFLTEGSYLGESYKNQIVLGEKLAKKLNVKLRSKVVLTFQQIDGSISSAAFRVGGIIKTPNSAMDQMRVIVKQTDLQQLLGNATAVHEWSIFLNDAKAVNTWIPTYKQDLQGDLAIESWLEKAPELAYIENSMDLYLYIFMGIIVLALVLGIVNTMLMAILERTRELGMLMAIGMPRMKVFNMIISETITLSCIGAPLGLFLAWSSLKLMGKHGLDLSAFADGLAAYGMSSVVYPDLKMEYLITISVLIFVASLLAALYPALKAIKLKPLEAIRLH